MWDNEFCQGSCHSPSFEVHEHSSHSYEGVPFLFNDCMKLVAFALCTLVELISYKLPLCRPVAIISLSKTLCSPREFVCNLGIWRSLLYENFIFFSHYCLNYNGSYFDSFYDAIIIQIHNYVKQLPHMCQKSSYRESYVSLLLNPWSTYIWYPNFMLHYKCVLIILFGIFCIISFFLCFIIKTRNMA